MPEPTIKKTGGMHVTEIIRAAEKDSKAIAHVGRLGVEAAHRDSCSTKDMNEFLTKYYNDNAIKEELADEKKLYHIIRHEEKAVGFSKIILNAEHPNIDAKNVTQLDRIYLLKEYYDLKLGQQLLSFNIKLSQENNQSGMWLFTWTGNERAINFYLKAGFKIIGSHKFKVTETHYNPNHHMFLKY